MNRLSTIIPAVATSLIFTSAFAGEPQFNVPSTARAAQSAQLLAQAANGLQARAAGLSNVWVFPTRDADTVYASYTQSSTEHLALVKVRDDGSVKVQDLTGDGRSAAHWSASIGTGRASNGSVPKTTTAGAPSSAHWTARIGTGRPAEVSDVAQNSKVFAQVASVHWTAKVGTARASDK